MSIDLFIVVVFLAINLFIGFWCHQRTVNFKQFSVGSRAFSSFAIFCTLSATFVGGGYTFGNAASVFSHGMIYAYALLGFSLKELLVATLIAPKMGAFSHCYSIGDIIETRFGRHAKIATGLFSLIICGGILGAQIGALSMLLDHTLPINSHISLIVSFVVLLTYASLGGMRAVVYTDIFQACILFIGIPVTLIIGLHHAGGFAHVQAALPAHFFSVHFQHQGWLVFVVLFLSFMLGETLVPPYAQRLLMAKTPLHTFRGTLYSALISVPLFLIAGGIGALARVLNPSLDANQAFVFLVNTVLPVGLKGFVIAALLAIILSSAAGFLNAAAIALTHDIVKPLKENPSMRSSLYIARISTVCVGLIALIFAFLNNNMLELLLNAYNFWSPILLVPIVFAIFQIKSPRLSFWLGGLAGIVGTLFWRYGLGEPLGLPPLVFGIVCNLTAYLVIKLYFLDTACCNKAT